MIDRENVIDALRNCINKPKCLDCPWEECSYDHEDLTLPKGLVMDIYDLLKAQKPDYKENVPVQSLIDHIKTAIDVDPWAKEMAEELLKNKKPRLAVKKWHKNQLGYYSRNHCPKCDHEIEKPTFISKDTSYCQYCGQEVKWYA